MSYSTTSHPKGMELEGIDLDGPVYCLYVPSDGTTGVRLRYTFSNHERARALYDASVSINPKVESRPVGNHLHDVYRRLSEEWVFPFIRYRTLTDTVVTFTLDIHPLPHGLSHVKDVIYTFLVNTPQDPYQLLLRRREANNKALVDWIKPPPEPYRYEPGVPLMPVSPLLKELWIDQAKKEADRKRNQEGK